MTHDDSAVGDWLPTIDRSGGALYRAIVESLAADIGTGRLVAGARLPPQRRLAEALGIDFTTVTRAYLEAQRQGLVEARVGRGTFVRRPAKAAPSGRIDLAMNLPPRPADPRLGRRLWQDFAALGEAGGLDLLMRYQAPGGTAEDRAAGAAFLSPRIPGVAAGRVLVAPGAQGALLTVTMHLATRGDVVLADMLTYPGYRALAARLGIRLVGVPADDGGMDPAALGDLAAAHRAKAVYLNPTLNNPTALTLSEARRRALAAVAERYGLAIIEDDAYGALPAAPPPSFAALAPDRTWHIAGLAKCLSPALRIAYLALPEGVEAGRLAAIIRATATMASPLTAALATRWIGDGTALALRAAIRAETEVLQAIAAECLPAALLTSDPEAFHAWLRLPEGWARSAFMARLEGAGIGLVASDAFALGSPPEAVRLGLGAAGSREALRGGLLRIAEILAAPPGLETLVV